MGLSGPVCNEMRRRGSARETFYASFAAIVDLSVDILAQIPQYFAHDSKKIAIFLRGTP